MRRRMRGLGRGREGECKEREARERRTRIRMYVHFYLIFSHELKKIVMTEQGSIPKGSTVIFTARSTENQ